jgi:hypothetical protein
MEDELKPSAEPPIDLDFEILDEAFLLKACDPRALQKKILSVAFLLEECSKSGNESIDGVVAQGFAEVLRDAARDAARLSLQLRQRNEA